MYRQQGQTHIPLRVNSAGMIPLIFAFSIMIFPPAAAQFVAQTSDVGWISGVARFFENALTPTQLPYWLFVFVLVVLFTFFYTMVQFQQQNLAENLQRQGGFIPGIRPGRPTQEYITRVLVRITWGGAIFLGFISVLPFFATRLTDVQALQNQRRRPADRGRRGDRHHAPARGADADAQLRGLHLVTGAARTRGAAGAVRR